MIRNILIFILCILLCSCDSQIFKHNDSDENSERDHSMNESYLLEICVNGTTQYKQSITYNREKKYAELPLISIIRSLGAYVDWIGDGKIVISYDNAHYILNPRERTLCKEGETFNIIAIPPGTTHGGYHNATDQEFYIDSDSARHFLYLLGVNIEFNHEKSCIRIQKRSKGRGDGLREP